METGKNNAFLHEIDKNTDGYDIYFRIFHDPFSFVSNHWHTAVEIIYLLSGELEVTLNEYTSLLKAGDFILINSRIVHSTKSINGNESIMLQLPYPFLKKCIPDISAVQLMVSSRPGHAQTASTLVRLKEILKSMRVLFEAGGIEDRLQFNSLLYKLLYLLYRDFRTEVLPSDYEKRSKNLYRLEPLIQYTQEHYTQRITIEEIAGIAALEPRYFCRFFKKYMGITYLEYLNEVRLSHIYHDLIATDFPLRYILELHGFTNYKLFRTLFYEKFRDTPGNLRRKKTDLSANSPFSP